MIAVLMFFNICMSMRVVFQPPPRFSENYALKANNITGILS